MSTANKSPRSQTFDVHELDVSEHSRSASQRGATALVKQPRYLDPAHIDAATRPDRTVRTEQMTSNSQVSRDSRMSGGDHDFGVSFHRCTDVIAGLILRPAYQRHISHSLVAEISENFSALLFKRLIVSRRDEQYWIVDGGNRLEGVKQRGWADRLVPVLLYEHLSYQQEAELFRSQRTARTLTPTDFFRADIEAGDLTALAIRAIVQARGFVINLDDPTRQEPGKLNAIGALRSVYRLGGDSLLRETMQVLASLYGGSQYIANWDIRGFALFLRWFPTADRSRLIRVAHELGYTQLRSQAVTYKGISGADYGTGIAQALHAAYNSSLRGGSREMLEPFDVRTLRHRMGQLRRVQQIVETPLADARDVSSILDSD